MSFPYKEITKEDALNSFMKLKNSKEKLAGNITTDYVMYPLRVRTKTGKWSHYEAWNNPEERKKIIAGSIALGKTATPAGLRGTMEMRYKSVNQFKPQIAKSIYLKYKPNRVLDFSAGWGGRMLGAVATNTNYIGIDSNKKLFPAYRKILDLVKSHYTSEVKLINKYSENVDFSKFNYDMVFTSPPYEKLEVYENMKDYSDFYKQFYIPVLTNSYKHLKTGGKFILNIPPKMLPITHKILGKHNTKFQYPLASRPGSKNYEYLYVWNK